MADLEMDAVNVVHRGGDAAIPEPARDLKWVGEYEEGATKYIGNLGLTFTGPEGNPMGKELMTWNLWRGFCGEFIATFFFLWIVVGNIFSSSFNDTPATLTGLGNARHLMIALAFGIAITVLVYVFATVSGGHINPAVSLMLMITKKITPLRFVVYVGAQCLGAIAGVATVQSMAFGSSFEDSNVGCNGLNTAAGFSRSGGYCAEIFSTMILILVVQAAVDHKQDVNVDYAGQGAAHIGGLAPLAIGFAVFLAHLINIPITGCSINPARTLGTAAVNDCWEDADIFWLGPFIGAVIAAVIYEVIIKDKKIYRAKTA